MVALADELGVDVPLARGAPHACGRDWGSDGQVRRPPRARRQRLEKMEQVYSFDMADGDGDFFRYTAEHLFSDIWRRPGLTDRTGGCS